MSRPGPLRFTKMHGAGNDFVVLDLRGGLPAPGAALASALGDRHTGVGFDQLLTVEDSNRSDCVARYRIWNSDGSMAQQCGNGARCVAAWLRRDGTAAGRHFRLDSPSGLIEVECRDDGTYALAMGQPEFRPERIPFTAPAEVPMHGIAAEADDYGVQVNGKPLRFGAVSMGNPHAVIEVDDIAAADVTRIGHALQASALFPQSVNVGFAQVRDAGAIALRVYERGAGETLACGSGACAAVVALVRRGRLARQVRVELPGGQLQIHWPGDGADVIMAGPAAFVFEGEWQHE